MRLETKYRLMVISMFIILLMFGVYIGFNLENKKVNVEPVETVISNNNEEDEVSIYGESTNNDIEVIYEDEYTMCSHVISNSEIMYNTNITLVKSQELEKQKKDNLEYQIIYESEDKIVFHRSLNQNCPNHFEIKLEEGIIVVYSIVNDTVKVIYKKVDVPQELISPEMLEELNTGIKADSKEELNLIMEDLES